MIFRHPSFTRLRAFALDESSGNRRTSVARHLESCTRCRERVYWIREVVAAVREPGPAAPADFAPIAARVIRRERVVLPVDASAGAAPHTRVIRRPNSAAARRWLAAAALLGLLGAGAILTRAPQAGAGRSELWFLPEKPRSGATLTLQYRATARLADEERLVVRARYRTSGPGAQPRTVEIGELHSTGSDRFEARIALPDSATYLVLAVEDPDSRFVDDHGERWEVIVHDDDGRPLFEALRQRYLDVRRRDTRLAEEVPRAMVEIYPDEPEGWYFLAGQESANLPRERLDSLREAYLADLPRLEAAVRARGEPSADQLWYLAMHAGGLRDVETRDRLRRELLARYPLDGASLQQAAFMAHERHRGDASGLLAALDSLWQLAPGASSQVAFDGWEVALQLGDPELIVVWADRRETSLPAWSSTGVVLVENPATREAGITRLRTAIKELEDRGGERPLEQTAAEHAATRRRQAGTYLAALGSALHAAGQSAAALDTLDRALDTGWNTTLFRAVGEARLELGDTIGALDSFARLAADPNTPPAFVDSLQTRLNSGHALGEEWHAGVATSREELRQELLDTSLNRAPLSARVRLRDPDGAAHELRLDGPRLTVVAFWSRYCPPSRADLPALEAAAQRLGEAGVRFVGIADEADGAAVATFLRENDLTMPTYLDPHREARNAFDSPGWPHYVLLDEDGRIRFTSHKAEDVLRQVAVLGGLWTL